MEYKVKDIALAERGKLKIEWAEARMPVLMHLRERHRKEKPLKGQRIADTWKKESPWGQLFEQYPG